MAVAEGALDLLPLGAGHRADVLGGDDLVGQRPGVQVAVIVVVVAPAVLLDGEPSGAAVARAGVSAPVTAALRRHDLLPVAGVAAQRRRLHLAVIEAPDPDVAGLKAVNAGDAVVGDADADAFPRRRAA